MAKLSDFINNTKPNTQQSSTSATKQQTAIGPLSSYIKTNDVKPNKTKVATPPVSNKKSAISLLKTPVKTDAVKGDLIANIQNRLATAPQTSIPQTTTAGKIASLGKFDNSPKAAFGTLNNVVTKQTTLKQPVQNKQTNTDVEKGAYMLGNVISGNKANTPLTGLRYDLARGAAGLTSLVEGPVDSVVGGMNNLGSTIASLGGTKPNAVSKWFDEGAKAVYDNDVAGAMRKGIADKVGDNKNWSSNLTGELWDMAGSIVGAGAAGKVASGVAKVSMPVLSKGIFGVSAGGNSAQQAYNEGATAMQAGGYGNAIAATTIAVESAFGGVPIFGKGILDDIIKGLDKSPKALQALVGMVGEGGEEAIQTFITPYLQRIYYNPNAKNATIEQMLTDAAYGAGLSGLMQGASLVGNIGANTNILSDNVQYTAQTGANNVQNNPLTPNLAKPAQNAPQQATQPTTNNITPNLVKLPDLSQNVAEAKQTTPEAKADSLTQTETENNPTYPNGTGAMSNPFTTTQKTSKVFTNTFQKTDSITDEQRAQMKPEDYQYDVRSKAVNEVASQQRVDVDFDGEVADLNSKQQWTDEDVYTSKKILDKVSADAEKSGNYAELNKWTKTIQRRGTTGGQTIEAFKAFQETPEGAVIKAQQVVAEVEKKLTKKKERDTEITNAKGRKIKADSDTAKKAMKESANESTNATDPANVAVEWWIRDTSKKLSEKIEANSKDRGAKASTDTTMQAMFKDLVKITQNSAPQGDVTKIKTNLATNTLRNYWANSEQYQGAVETAQRYINEKYSNDPETLATFNDWLAGNGVNTWATLGKALQENGVNYNDILMSSWQDKAVLLDNVTNKILADTDLTADEAKSAAQAISDKFYDELAIRAQKKIEQLLKPTTPKQQKTMTQRVNEFVNSGVFDDSAIVDFVSAKYGIPSLTAADVQKIYELNKLAQETTDDYQKRVYINRSARIIVDKMPVTGKEKVLAIRRIAMLLNPKTLISRNAGGNVIFGLLEDIKDAPGTLVDMATTKLAKTGVRTTSYNPLATAKAEFIGAKKGLTEWGKDIKNKVDTSPTQHEMPQTPALKSKVGSAFESVLNKLLQVGDRPFYEAAKAKRIDELKRLGRDYTSDDAIGEANVYALERVFQNNSTLAKKAMQLRDALGVIGDIAIPFAQTPANIFDKLADYSPYGFVRAIKKAGTIKDSAWSQKQFVDTLSRSMTGTGILAFAYFAAQAGLISGGDDKEKDEALTYQKKISGWQPYSIIVGDKSYTYDWSTVVGALLSLGADISQSDNAGDTLLAILSNGAKAGINTMFNQSYMEGVAELFGSSSGGKTDIGKGLESMLVGLPASFTPSAFQQIAKIIDPIARDTYDSDPFKRAWNKVKAKIPMLSQTLPAKVGASGMESTNYQGSKLSNILESTLSPGFIGETQKTSIDSEVQRLYKTTDNTAVLPNWSEYTSKSDLSFSGNGTEYTMTPQEWEKYQKTRGQYTYKELDKLTKSTEYKNMTDAEKAKAVSSIYSDATTNARMTTVEARGEMYIANSDVGDKITKYQTAGITQRQAYNLNKTMSALTPVQGEKEVSDYQRIKTIGSQGYTDKQAIALVGTLYTSKDKSSMLPYLTTSKHLLSLYLTNKDSEMISMSVPSKVTQKSVEYELTDKEKEVFKNSYANYFNSRVNNITSAEAIKKLRDKAFDAAKTAVIQNR